MPLLSLSEGGSRLCRTMVFGLASLGCAGFGTLAAQVLHAAEPIVVNIDNFAFTPKDLTVSAGSLVIWENQDDIPHSIVIDDKSFRSKPLDTHDAARFTFNQPGRYPYYCGLHPHMQGNVTVTP